MPEQKRQLAAIMFTDIVGYTALMGEDEEKAYALLKKNRQLQKPLIEKHGGKWLKEMGDGVLASFPSVSDAVYCAIEIQEACRREPDLKLRIGMHQGEVIVEDDDVFGDGVNIASRIEPLAPAGSVYASEAVYRNIGNKKNIQTTYIREETLKNVRHPVRIYEIKSATGETVQQETKPLHAAGKSFKARNMMIISSVMILLLFAAYWFIIRPAGFTPERKVNNETVPNRNLAVIPFWNDSPDKDNEYFCRGMEEEIRIQLLKISNLKIESRQAVESYRERKDIDLVTIGKELDVSYIIEGSVRKFGEDIKVTVQLIDAHSGDHIWGETYAGNYDVNLLSFQSMTALEIAEALNAAITPSEAEEINVLPTNNIKAYDLMIRAQYNLQNYWSELDSRLLVEGHRLIDRAIELDPDFLQAMIIKTSIFLGQMQLDSVLAYTDKILVMDPDNAMSYLLKGDVNFFRGNADLAIENYEKSIALRPQWGWTHSALGRVYSYLKKDILKAMYYHDQELKLNPKPAAATYLGLFSLFYEIGDLDRAKLYLDHAQAADPTHCWIFANYARLYITHDEFDLAVQVIDSTCNTNQCQWSCARINLYVRTAQRQYSEAGRHIDSYLDFIGQGFEIDHKIDSILMAKIYLELGDHQKANLILESIESNIEDSNFQFFSDDYIQSAIYSLKNDRENCLNALKRLAKNERWKTPDHFLHAHIYENLEDDPEFKAIMAKANEEKARIRKQINDMVARGELDL